MVGMRYPFPDKCCTNDGFGPHLVGVGQAGAFCHPYKAGAGASGLKVELGIRSHYRLSEVLPLCLE